MVVKKIFRRNPMERKVMCNCCGEIVEKFQIVDNGYFCFSCFPNPKEEEKPKPRKKIPNENQMLTKILEKVK
jgi:hypothetical protein